MNDADIRPPDSGQGEVPTFARDERGRGRTLPGSPAERLIAVGAVQAQFRSLP